MNLYILVEGRQCERKLYPRWLSYLLPTFARVASPDAVDNDNYYLISGEGYPHLLDKHLPNSIADVNDVGRFDYLVLCLDSDEDRPAERAAAIESRVADLPIKLSRAQLRIVLQHRCVETWLLGNRHVFSRTPQNATLRKYIEYYNVCNEDPERMHSHADFNTHAQFHADYLRLVFKERNITYSKSQPGHACDEAYLTQLVSRVESHKDHLQSFQDFLGFCRGIAAHAIPRT
jgi:hypothetical protein